jgi:type II secretory pathway pseudopilin PulG
VRRLEVQMLRTTPSRRRAQRGMSLIGLMAWAIIIGFIGYLAVRVLPTVNEFLTVQRAVDRVAAESPATVAEVRRAFDKQKDIEYSIGSISGKDLDVTKENDKLVIRFAYDKEIPIVEPVYLLLKYKGRSK